MSRTGGVTPFVTSPRPGSGMPQPGDIVNCVTRAHRSPIGRVIAGTALLVVVMATLIAVFAFGIRTTTNELKATNVASWSKFDRQSACLRHSIETELPKGSTVYVYDRQTYDAQRLNELVPPWVVSETRRSSARFTISIVAGKSCDGVRLQVQRR